MNIKKQILTLFGILFLILGGIGLFLPVWPTTPFVLLSVACLSSNPKLQSKVLKIPFVIEYVESYKNKTGLPIKVTVSSLSFLWFMLILSMIIKRSFYLNIALMIIGILVTIHIVWIYRNRQKLELEDK